MKKERRIRVHTRARGTRTLSSGRGVVYVCVCMRGGLCVKEENAKMSFSSAIF